MTGSLQIKNDKYYAVLNFKDCNGKRAQKWVPLGLPAVKGNKRLAEAKLKELVTEYHGIERIEPMNTLLAQHIAMWIEMDRPNISVTTYNQYINILNNHIIPYFNPRGITLSNVTAGDLEDYYNFKISGGLSPNTVIKHHAVIRSALQWAVKHRYIRENVADFANRPERIKYHPTQPYNVLEVAELIRLTMHEPIAVPVFLACFYGLRRSEILGLRWSSIDFVGRNFTVSTTVVKEKHGDRILTVVRDGMTKTETSMRTLPLCEYTYEYFTTLYQKQHQQRMLCGAGYNREFMDFVCVDPMGNLLQPDFVSQKFQLILKKYNLRPIRFHDLRHSCATIMLYLGYSLKDIQTWLGHSNYNFTADTYVHTAPTAHLAMANTLSQKLGEFMPPIE